MLTAAKSSFDVSYTLTADAFYTAAVSAMITAAVRHSGVSIIWLALTLAFAAVLVSASVA